MCIGSERSHEGGDSSTDVLTHGKCCCLLEAEARNLHIEEHQGDSPYADDVRITVLNREGEVIFESTDSIAGQSHKNHLNREEVQQALRDGEGYAVIRSSETTGIDYFYSATCFGDYIVRSALPYDTQLRQSLASDRHYLYAAILITFVLLGLFLYMTRRLSHTENDNQQLQTRLQLEQEYNQYKRELSNNIALHSSD